MRNFVYVSIIGAALALTATDAFAYIVCNPHGDCWRSGGKIPAALIAPQNGADIYVERSLLD